MIEQMEIRDLIDAVRALLAQISKHNGAHERIADWLTSFEDLAKTAHPRLDDLPPPHQNIPPDLEFAFAPKLLSDVRPRLILSGIDLIRLLTSPAPATQEHADASARPDISE